MVGKDPDVEVWRRAQQRDEGAYEQLRRKYRSVIAGEIRKRLYNVNHDDLQDLEQNIWIAVWTSLPRFRGASTFNTWVVGIAKNVIFNWIRSKKTEARFVIYTLDESLSVDEEACEDKVADGIDTQAVHQVAIQDAMRQLLATEREVIYFRYFVQLTDEEIAQRIDLPLGTVKSRMRAGLGKLRGALQAAEGETQS